MLNKILDDQQNAENKIEQNEEDQKEEWPITPDDEYEYFNAKDDEQTSEEITDEQMPEEISEEEMSEEMSEEEISEEEISEEIPKEITDEQMSKEIVITRSNNLLEQSTNEFDFDLFLEILELMYPTLKEEIITCSKETIWLIIKEITGVDINVVKDIYSAYHKEKEESKERKNFLKRHFIEAIYPECNKKHCC